MVGNISTASVYYSRSVNLIAAIIVNLVFAFGGAFLNSLVIFVFLASTLLRRKVCYFLIMVLSCIDLVVVVVVHPLTILYYISELRPNHSCLYEKLHSYSGLLLCSLSGYTLLAMNVERYVAIVQPYLYQRTVTKRKLLLLLGLLWIFVLTSWLLAIHFTIMKRIMVVGTILLFFLITIPIYARIFVIAIQKRQQTSFSAPDSSVRHEKSIRKYKDHFREVRFASMYVLVILCAAICYCPVVVFYGLKHAEFKPCSKSTSWWNIFPIWSGTVVNLNSTFNCLIFFWKNSTLRNESKIVLRKCFRVQTIPQIYSEG